MKQGDFTELAKFYLNRPGYSLPLLDYIQTYVKKNQGQNIMVADVGAGTGKLTENLEQLGNRGYAVEPNDAMRAEGIKLFAGRDTFQWLEGSGEMTNLPDSCVDWVLMGSSFHWTDAKQSLKEFHRILRPGGFFTAIWNPRDIERSPLHMRIEETVYAEIPNIKRVSSGRGISTEEMHLKFLEGGEDGIPYFGDLVFMEAPHEEIMTVERYMNIWRSVNDIQAQAGEEGFQRILSNIEDILKENTEIKVPYKSRAWIVRSNKKN